MGLRKIVWYLLMIAIVLGFILYFVANSPLVIKKVADHFAPDYNISYSSIHGNALTGIKIDDLAYNHELLAKHVALRWNPNGIFRKKIIVNKLEIEKANVDTIKTLIASFSQADSNESNESGSSDSSLDIGVNVNQVFVSLEPFVEQGIGISNVVLDAKGIAYTQDNIDVDVLNLQIDSNVTDIALDVSLDDGHVNIKELNITNVDILALKALFVPDNNESNVSDVNETIVTVEENSTTEPLQNPLIPKWVYLEKLEVSTLPFKYDPVDMKQLRLSGRDALFDVQNLLLQKANLDLNSSTNLSDVDYTTTVKNNKMAGRVHFKPKKELFKLYELPVRREAVGDIVFDLNVSEKEVVTDLKITMEQLLKGEKDDFNLDIDSLHSHLVYDIQKGTIEANSKVLLTTPYVKDVLVTNRFTMDDEIHYSGEIKAKQAIGVEAKFVKPLNNLYIKYEGNDHSIKTVIDADNLQGSFTSDDFKKALFHLENKETLVLNEFIELPAELNETKADIVIHAPLSFEANATMEAFAKIDSNVVNMDTNISYKDRLRVKSTIHIPNESLLRAYSEEVKWDRLDPIKSEVELAGDTVDAKLDAGPLKVNVQYDINSTNVDGTVRLGGLNGKISGIPQEKMTIDTKISSMNALIESIKEVYALGEIPVVKGSADISVGLTQMKNLDVALRSPQIIYQADRKTDHIINDIALDVSLEDQKIVVDQYRLTYDDQKLFSTKPSTITLNDTTLTISPFWLNDELKVEGNYDLKMRKGAIDADADKLHIAHKIIDLDNKIDIKTVLDGNKTSVNGEIILLGGDIHYDLAQKTYASDSDIIIVQDMKTEKEASPFMDNLSVAVQIKTKKPLVYKKGNIDIQASVDLSVYKAEGSELMILGSVEILKGGSYRFEGKKFVLDQSFVHFTGNPNKPLIEASVKYKSLNHLITIMVTGSADSPNINFSSKPSLTKEQILSIILFDSEGGAGTNSGQDMMKMMGGAMAKSALSDLGVQLDHLVLGEGSVEVGKKLTDKMTIIYVNDEVASVKLEYEHGIHTQSVIGVSEESQSYDIIYKKDY